MQPPNSCRVLADRAVGRKLPTASDICNRHTSPGVAIEPRGGGSLLSRDVRGEVGEHEVGIGAREAVDKRPEHLAIAARKPPIRDEIECRSELGVALEVVARPIALPLHPLDVRRRQAEEEKVVGADLLPDLDVGAVEGADRDARRSS